MTVEKYSTNDILRQIRDNALIGGSLTDVQLRATPVPVSVSGGATSAKQDTGNTSLASIDAKLTTQAGYLDGLEALITSANGYVDGLETLATTLNGYTDGIEGLIGTTNTTLTTLGGYVDGLEALVTSTNGYVDGLEAALAGTLNTRPADGILTCTTSITRPADTNAYTVNDALSNSTSAPTANGFVLTGAARASGKSVVLTDVLVLSSNNAATTLQGELYIFDTAVTNINDNAAFGFSDSELLTLVAKVPFTLVQGANNSHHHVQNLNIGITTVGSANLLFLVKVLNAYTPASAEVVTVRAKFLPVN